MKEAFFQLKQKLQQYGAITPAAWTAICSQMKLIKITYNTSFIRKEGTLAYMAKGLLKECTVEQRNTPSIIGFISNKQCLLTRRHNQNHYLKACTDSTICYWDLEALESLYKEFKELKAIYDHLCAEYDTLVFLRMRLLEMSVVERITTFKSVFKEVLPYLKKKDIANYLNLHYTHFLRHWNS